MSGEIPRLCRSGAARGGRRAGLRPDRLRCAPPVDADASRAGRRANPTPATVLRPHYTRNGRRPGLRPASTPAARSASPGAGNDPTHTALTRRGEPSPMAPFPCRGRKKASHRMILPPGKTPNFRQETDPFFRPPFSPIPLPPPHCPPPPLLLARFPRYAHSLTLSLPHTFTPSPLHPLYPAVPLTFPSLLPPLLPAPA